MSSIPQNIKNEIDKIIKNVIMSSFKCNLTSLSEQFFMKNSSISIPSKLNSLIIEIYKRAIPLIDNMFLNSDYRKKNFYKANSHERTIIKTFGELNFKRNYYVDKNKKNGFYFIDEIFNFEKYTTYDPVIRAILIDRSVDTNANNASMKYDLNLLNLKEYLTNDFHQKIPRQTIYNWLHSWSVPKVKYDYIDEKSEHLYVMVDEKWIHEQIRLSQLPEKERKKHHFIMGKCFVTFTGAKRKNNRTSLLNRHVFMTSSNRPWKKFMDEIYDLYNFEKLKEIYLLSDSGTWILSGKSELKLFPQNKVISNTCEFHVKQYINRLTSSKELRASLNSIIYEERDKKMFINLTNKILEENLKNDKKEKYMNYILKHWKAILNMQDREVKSSMESHISHFLASHFSSRPKGYSRKNIEKYIKLQEYKLNGINIMDLYLKSYDKKDEIVYNKKEVSYSIFEHNTNILPIKCSSDHVSCAMHGLAYGF